MAVEGELILCYCVSSCVSSLLCIVSHLLVDAFKECENKQIKIKSCAAGVIGELYAQIGPMLEAFVKSKDPPPTTMSLVNKAIADNTYDPNSQNVARKRRCLVALASDEASGGNGQSTSSSGLSVPSTDLVASLKDDILDRITTTDGKTSWKLRKEAMEQVMQTANKCSGLLATDSKASASASVTLKQLVVALRSRLNDSQSNLKPLAATVLGCILSHIDGSSQAKLGKALFPSLANGAMVDMKKTMRDACISALTAGTTRAEVDGGCPNAQAIEIFIVSLSSELSEAALKSTGLSDVLAFLNRTLVSMFDKDNAEPISSTTELAAIIVKSLLSKKSDIRSEAEKLHKMCSESNVIPSETLDNEIKRLLPAQQRTVRSVIPKLSAQEKEYVDTFKKDKPSHPPRQSVQARLSTQQQSVRRELPKPTPQSPQLCKESNQVGDVEHGDPLALSRSKPNLKMQRLAVLGKGDYWPEYPKGPTSDATLHALCKSWSALIPSSSIELLFPKGGLKTMEDAVAGCEVITKSIGHSRNANDTSIIEQLDLVFKWAAFAMATRDHTVGLRSLLDTIEMLFGRLGELSYTMNDAEALILLPLFLEKAAMVKANFHEQLIRILSFITANKIYPTQAYGAMICVKVIDKSLYPKARCLAANESLRCVQSPAGLKAIGKVGLIALGNALSVENLTENRMSYLVLFEIIVEKMNGNTEKLFDLVGDSLTDKARDMILERCPKVAETQQTKLRTPSRKSTSRFIEASPAKQDGQLESTQSSLAARELLRQRLQSRGGSSLPVPPPNNSSRVMPPPIPPIHPPPQDLYAELMGDITLMIQRADSTSDNNVLVAKGTASLHKLYSFSRRDETLLTAHQIGILTDRVGSDFNGCLVVLAR